MPVDDISVGPKNKGMKCHACKYCTNAFDSGANVGFVSSTACLGSSRLNANHVTTQVQLKSH